MHHAGLVFANAWGSVKFAAHIYNAVRNEKFCTKLWGDLEVVMANQGYSSIFVGSPPKTLDDYFKQFLLGVGYSASNFAKNRHPGGKPAVAADGPRKSFEAEHDILISHELELGYTMMADEKGRKSVDLEKVLQRCIEEAEDEDGEYIDSTGEKLHIMPKRQKKAYTLSEALILIAETLMAEELALTLDLFRMHRLTWQVLRGIHEKVDPELKRIYGMRYIEAEHQLPFAIGYILMTAVETRAVAGVMAPKKRQLVSSDVLKEAGRVIEGMIDSGMGGLELKILREHYGMDMAVPTFEGDFVEE